MARTHDDADERLNDTYGSMPTLPYAILNGVSGGVALLAWLAVLQLTIFHAGLISRGMTTYEFIIAQVNPCDPLESSPPRDRAHLCSRVRSSARGRRSATRKTAASRRALWRRASSRRRTRPPALPSASCATRAPPPGGSTPRQLPPPPPPLRPPRARALRLFRAEFGQRQGPRCPRIQAQPRDVRACLGLKCVVGPRISANACKLLGVWGASTTASCSCQTERWPPYPRARLQ